MSTAHLWIFSNLVWLALLSYVGRFTDHGWLDLSSIILVVAASGWGLFASLKKRFPVLLLFAMPVGCLGLMIMVQHGAGHFESGIDSVATGVLAVMISTALAWRAGRAVGDLHRCIAELEGLRTPPSYEDIQGAFYHEVRRARQYKRAVSLVSLKPATNISSDTLGPGNTKLHDKLLKQYAEAKLAESIASCLGDCDLLAKSHRGYFVMLPEADREIASATARNIKAICLRDLGCDLLFGIADFPQNELTLSGLLHAAEDELELAQAASHLEWHEQVASSSNTDRQEDDPTGLPDELTLISTASVLDTSFPENGTRGGQR